MHNRKHPSVIAKLRSSTLNRLSVESGRYRGLIQTERVCYKYVSGDIDDEEHCLLWCNCFHNQRKPLISKAVELIPGFMIFTGE